MRIIIAPDSFKGSLSAWGVAVSIEAGLKKILPPCRYVKVPLSDGGEGLVEILVRGTGGKIIRKTVSGPLGEPVEAFYGILGDGNTAVIEMATASGLDLVPGNRRDPLKTTTWGTGELIRAVLKEEFSHLIIGVGGSATVDGGIGMAQALGVKFYGPSGELFPPKLSGKDLLSVCSIDRVCLQRLVAARNLEITVACDVDNPLCGPLGAAKIYAPQKGATATAVELLEKGLKNWSTLIQRYSGYDLANVPGAGAAGGLGAGLLFFLEARLRPGFEVVRDILNLPDIFSSASLVVTGEGKIDQQTAYGKVPVGVARLAKKYGIPVVVLAGWTEEGVDKLYQDEIDLIMSIIDRPMSLMEALAGAETLVERAAQRLGRALWLGSILRW